MEHFGSATNKCHCDFLDYFLANIKIPIAKNKEKATVRCTQRNENQ